MKEYEPDWDIKLPHALKGRPSHQKGKPSPNKGKTMAEITGNPNYVSPNKGKTYKKRLKP